MWGAPAITRGIIEICKKIGCYLLKDCSHANGATIDGQMVGKFGDAAAWSLQYQKIFHTQN
jgi:dTDP-4-amino-4,6-dideoxygalactose transaminase